MEHPLVKELLKHRNKEKAAFFPRFFRTGKGEYGEGDVFIGVTIPHLRSIVKNYRTIPLKEVQLLLKDKRHEVRWCALFILTEQFKKGDEQTKKKIYEFYLDHLKWVNNWDLVDSSAYHIVGEHLIDKNRRILRTMARSRHLWTERVAIVSTLAFIRKGQLQDTFEIAELLIAHPHDLLHKAVGWMLREAGKRNDVALKRFLNENAMVMPRTMLRYAIEKFDEKTRKMYLLMK
jgi:3-methyladenine DNA glycosylase AlkD